MWARLLLLFSVAAGVRAQQDPADLLRLVRTRVSNSLDRLPRYMCTLTIDRTVAWPDVDAGPSSVCDGRPGPRSTHLVSSDRLRLDVAKSDVEMYSWVGESRFDDHDIAGIVRDGAISDGSSVAFLNDIFRADNAIFTYNGDATEDGRTSSEFGFTVARENSRYAYSNGKLRVIAGYEGTFLADPKTGDLLQLVLRTSKLPPETGACYVSTTLDYKRVSLAGASFLLPAVSLLHILNDNGVVSENHTAFSGCHEFLGEATISFDAPKDFNSTETRGASGSQVLIIPPGLPFRVTLTQGIDTATAAAGDLIKGALVTPLRNGSKVLAPTGASVNARIVGVRQFYGAAPYVQIDFRLETVEAGKVSLPLTAHPDNGNRFPKARPGTLQQRVELGRLSSLNNAATGTLVFGGAKPGFLVPSGIESNWVTAAP